MRSVSRLVCNGATSGIDCVGEAHRCARDFVINEVYRAIWWYVQTNIRDNIDEQVDWDTWGTEGA